MQAAEDSFVVSDHRIQFDGDLEIGFQSGRAEGSRLLSPTYLALDWPRFDVPPASLAADEVFGGSRVPLAGGRFPPTAATDSASQELSAALDSLRMRFPARAELPPFSATALAQAQTYAALIDTSLFSSPLLREAAEIIRGWDGTFTASSIGATIYDAWLGTPTTQPPDTSQFFASARVTSDFASAVGRLARSQGASTGAWRWSSLNPRRLSLPLAEVVLSPSRSGLRLAGYGYPSALAYQQRAGADSLSAQATFAVGMQRGRLLVAAPRYTPERMFDSERRRFDVPKLRTLSWDRTLTLRPE
jgi:hypothetical protein